VKIPSDSNNNQTSTSEGNLASLASTSQAVVQVSESAAASTTSSVVIESIKVIRPALSTGLLIEPLSHYDVKVLLRYKYRIPAFHVDIAEPIRYLGQYKVNYSRNKSVMIDVVAE